MKEIIEDLFETVRRLNNELDERTEFEHKLMDIISKKDEEIDKLNILLHSYEKDAQDRILREDIKAEIKTEQILDKALNTEPLVKVE
jgi:hypothetical protein